MSLSKRFSNKVILITGGARGIGYNIGSRFAHEGGRVFLADINRAQGETAAEALKKQDCQAEFLETDLSIDGAAAGMIDTVCSRAGRLDVLVNNARSGKRADLGDETPQSWDQTFGVTLKAAFFSSQSAIRQMSQMGGGCIVNIASVSAIYVSQESPSYHIAKAGVVQMTRYLAARAGSSGVRVNTVLPGFIVQDEHRQRFDGPDNASYRRLANFCHPGGDVGTSDNIAEAVMMLCRDESSFITGQSLTVDGGLTLHDQFSLLYHFSKQNS